jgi:hypothetical protein
VSARGLVRLAVPGAALRGDASLPLPALSVNVLVGAPASG